jgi:branched-chain amino acid transport system substrate-binding protein
MGPVSLTRRPGALVLAAVAAAMTVAACGSAVPHDKIVAAANGNAQLSTNGAPGAAANNGNSGGQVIAGTNGTTTGGQAGTSGSGGTGGAGATGGGTSSGTASGGDKSPIIIGSVGNYSGVPGAILKYEPITLQVWAKYVNAHGGVAGHPVQVIVVDDGSDPARYKSAVRDLVENKHVVAFVDQGASQTANAGEDYLEQKRIPVIGAGDGNPAWSESWPYFNVQDPNEAGMDGVLHVAAKYLHSKKIAILACVEGSICTDWYDNLGKYAPRNGMQVVYRSHISLAQPDYTQECLNARRAGADLVLPVGDANSFHRVYDDCARQSYHPGFVAAAPSDLDKGRVNVVGASGAFPFDGIPGDKYSDEYLNAFKSYSPDTPLNIYTSLSWATAKLFEHVVETSIGTAKPTSAKILDGMWALKNYTVNGLTLPLSYPKMKAGGGPPFCWFAYRLTAAGWTAPNGLKYDCDKPA